MKVNAIEEFIKEGFRITSPYGWRVHPITGERKMHTGTDLGGKPRYTPVKCWYDGVVLSVGFNTSYGNRVFVKSNLNKVVFMYAHLTDYSVKAGQAIKAGDVIGRLGTTGSSTGVHLHYEIRKEDGTSNGGAVWGDPATYYEETQEDEMEKTPIYMEGTKYEGLFIEGKTYVVLRPFAEALKCKVNYQGSVDVGTIVIPPVPVVCDDTADKKIDAFIKALDDLYSQV